MIKGSCDCGSVQWELENKPDTATTCNCTICRRYGVLWAYDYENQGVKVSGQTQSYDRGTGREFHFCPICGCVAFWRAQHKDKLEHRCIAVNLRLAEPDDVAEIIVKRIDGLDTFKYLPNDERCIADYWF